MAYFRECATVQTVIRIAQALVLEVERLELFAIAPSIIKFQGFGGKIEFWDYNFESLTLVADHAGPLTALRDTKRTLRSSGRMRDFGAFLGAIGLDDMRDGERRFESSLMDGARVDVGLFRTDTRSGGQGCQEIGTVSGD